MSNLQELENKNNKLFFSKKNNNPKIQDFLKCTLDQTKLEDSDYIIKKGTVTIPLHKSKKYSIKANEQNITWTNAG